MQSTLELAESILDIVDDSTINRETKIKLIKESLTWHHDDVLKLIDNINRTSFNEADRMERIIDMEAKYGIPKTHLIIK